MIEYSSPNTNKPLHLGHVRNNLLGNALANIVMPTVISSKDKYCQRSWNSYLQVHVGMVQKYGNGETPESSGKKGGPLGRRLLRSLR